MQLVWIERLVMLGLRVWRAIARTAPTPAPVELPAQRDIAIDVAASETARQEGHRAKALTEAKQRQEEGEAGLYLGARHD